MGYKRPARVLFASADTRLAAVAMGAASRMGGGWLETCAVRGDALADMAIGAFDLIVALDAPSHAALQALRGVPDICVPPFRFYACESEIEVVARVEGMINGMRMLARADE